MNYTGISSLDNFTVNYNSSTSTFTFTDPSGGSIIATSIETFSFGGKSYVHYTGEDGTDLNRNVEGFWSESENLLMLYGKADNILKDFHETNKTLPGLSRDENLTIIGSSENNQVSIGNIGEANDSNDWDGGDYSGTVTVRLGVVMITCPWSTERV